MLLEPCIDFTMEDRQEVLTVLERRAYELAKAIRNSILKEDDEAMADANDPWLFTRVSTLSSMERERLELAAKRTKALTDFRSALQLGDANEILRIYRENENLLRPCRNLRLDERAQISAAREAALLQAVEAAMTRQDADEISTSVQLALWEGCQLTERHSLAFEWAQQILNARARVDEAIAMDDDLAISLAHDRTLLDGNKHLKEEQRERVTQSDQRVRIAFALRLALAQDDDRSIDRLHKSDLFAGSRVLSPEEHERCSLAHKRLGAWSKVKNALQAANKFEAVEVYDEGLLESSKLLTNSQRQYIKRIGREQVLLRELSQTLEHGSPAEIADVAHATTEAGFPLTIFNPASWSVIYDASTVVNELRELRSAIRDEDDMRIAQLWSRILFSDDCGLMPSERVRIDLALRRAGALLRLRRALDSGETRRVRFAYQPDLLLPCTGFTTAERQQTAHLIQAARLVAGPQH
jgi:hypothetical protein